MKMGNKEYCDQVEKAFGEMAAVESGESSHKAYETLDAAEPTNLPLSMTDNINIDQKLLDTIEKEGPGALKLSLDGEWNEGVLTILLNGSIDHAPFGIGKFVNVVIDAMEDNTELQASADTMAKFLRDDIEKCIEIIEQTEANLLDVDPDVPNDFLRVIQSFVQILEGIYACCMKWKECAQHWRSKASKAKEYNAETTKFRDNFGNDKSNLILVMQTMRLEMNISN